MVGRKHGSVVARRVAGHHSGAGARPPGGHGRKNMKISRRSVVGAVMATVAAMAFSAPALAQADKEGKKPEKAAAKIGEQAPAFELKDTDGKTVKLADYKGKVVVL